MTETDRKPLLTGACQCGALHYALFARPDVDICHCRMCQRAMGNLFMPAAGVALADFAWTQGAPATYRGSSVAERGFCRDCGTPLTFRYLAKEAINVTVGSLDDPAAARPTAQLGVESRVPWWSELIDLPATTTAEDPPPGGVDALRSFQRTTAP